METNFNFRSQVCTSRSQSKKLLALGIKPETADMSSDGWNDPVVDCGMEWSKEIIESGRLPAWSLSRLIEMMPNSIYFGRIVAYLTMMNDRVLYDTVKNETYAAFFNRNGLFDNVVCCIEWLIKDGHFPKEYLENGN